MGKRSTRRHFLTRATTTSAVGALVASGAGYSDGRAKAGADPEVGLRDGARTQERALVFVGSKDGTLHAVGAGTGERLWAVEGAAETAPTVVDGTVYVGSGNGSVHALDAATGETYWTFNQASGRVTSPTVVYGSVYVGTRDESLYALDAATGEQQWAYTTSMEHLSPIYSAPNVVDQTVYFGTHHSTSDSWYPSTVHALDAQSGDERWVFDEPQEPVDASPVAADGTVYAASLDYSLYAIDAASGEERWRFDEPGNDGFGGAPVVVDDTVYARSWGTNLHALEAATGSKRWTFSELPGPSDAAPTVVDGVAYVDQYAVDTTTGEAEWEFETSADNFSTPTVFRGTVYVGATDGRLYAVDAGSGGIEWTYDTGSEIWTAPTVAPDSAGGHSRGSRVALGTVGHHHSWAGAEPTSVETETATAVPTTVQSGDGGPGPTDRGVDAVGSGGGPNVLWLAPAALGLVGLGGAAWAVRRRSVDDGPDPGDGSGGDRPVHGDSPGAASRTETRTRVAEEDPAPVGGPPACPDCGGQNDPNARFCQHCGAGLSIHCPSCGSRLTGDEAFCPACGDPVQ
ncbi:PQQ-binding-like beta-propeller repeat protein [Haloarchaeobius sp. FL176]|uniref:outer membrane protein assembly factor BamB family protein n=1 Tax=Haloarchaeobius sp. FL176 TaxID=2967129 RepID=UPI00214836DF|nr:PQQ-binding-like beta-propeller repeat protein [Haloarchaeobius sp. FL176]